MSARALIRHLGGGMFNALAELGAVRLAPPIDRRAAAHRLAGALGAIARAHDVVVTAHGEIPRTTALLVGNQIGYLDPIAVLPLCPALPVTRSGVLGGPIVGPIVAHLGAVVAKPRRIHEVLAGGTSVFAAPVAASREVLGRAQQLGVPIVPIAIRYRDPGLAWRPGAALLPQYLRLAASARIEIAVGFGRPLVARPGEPSDRLCARAGQAIEGVLAAIDERDRFVARAA